MEARIKNPVMSILRAFEAMEQPGVSATSADIPMTTHYLVWLRASQVNGCSARSYGLAHAGEPIERIAGGCGLTSEGDSRRSHLLLGDGQRPAHAIPKSRCRIWLASAGSPGTSRVATTIRACEKPRRESYA